MRPSALLAALSPLLSRGGGYSKLDASTKCADFGLPDVASKEECFATAAPAVGLGASMVRKLELNGVGFNGCVHNIVEDSVIWSVSPGVSRDKSLALSTLQHICLGSPPSPERRSFARLKAGSVCAEQGVADVASSEACFGPAAAGNLLGGKKTMVLNNLGFSGCVFNSAADALLFGRTEGVGGAGNMRQRGFEYLCEGRPGDLEREVQTTTIAPMSYERLPGGTKCWERVLAGIFSKEGCFGDAVRALGLEGARQAELHNRGFTGCLYDAEDRAVYWGVTEGLTPQSTAVLPTWEYLCRSAR